MPQKEDVGVDGGALAGVAAPHGALFCWEIAPKSL